MKEKQANTSTQGLAAGKRQRRIRPAILVGCGLLVLLVGLAAIIYPQQRIALGNRVGIMLLEAIGQARNAGGTVGAATLKLPAGFRAEVWASGLTDPRFMAFAQDGTLFVAERGTNSIVALADPQQSGKAVTRRVVVSGLDQPSSVAFYGHMLFVGETSRVSRLTLDDQYHVTKREVVVPNLPTVGAHVTRTVFVGPDSKLYVSIGSSCNVCNEEDAHRASVWVYNLDGSAGRRYVRGLRNAVGLALNPWDKQIWATNNGRDMLGDDVPPETVYALREGGDYGWPVCHAGNIVDPQYGHSDSCHGIVKPLVKIQAHSAPLGLAFYEKGTFPQQYHGLFVALHGSWNRSQLTGYKVVFVPLDGQGNVSAPPQDFITGWLNDSGERRGRPVGLAIASDGALYVSDDAAGLIYRVTYTG
ncbi:PQQ-dependent sugar dehydrogenase [Ktedonosporobacter rubrisoli]|nr:PQQ-dependent sugar dehydrogenase [Ktedonosporobacter rubrisoli]